MLRRASLKLGTPWVMSLAIHVVMIGVLTLVAVRAALTPPPPERYIDFDDPGASSVEPALAEQPRPSTPTPPDTQPLQASRPADITPAPSTGVATSDDAERAGAPAPDAWLAPASITPAPGQPATTAPALSLPSTTPKGREVRFAGLGSSNARSVVYVVDASGPMVSSLREVVEELDRSVSRLNATQRFGVVVFRRVEGDASAKETESFMPVLVRATPKAKEELRAWLKKLAPAGRSNPLAGLRVALEMRPDAIFLLSRGIERSGGGIWELGLAATMDELDRLNPVVGPNGRREVSIKTIQFLDEDPTGTMQRIAQIHGKGDDAGGRPAYRVVTRGSELRDDPQLEDQP